MDNQLNRAVAQQTAPPLREQAAEATAWRLEYHATAGTQLPGYETVEILLQLAKMTKSQSELLQPTQ